MLMLAVCRTFIGLVPDEDIGSAFEGLGHEVQALYVCASALFNANIGRINTLASGERLPTMTSFREYVELGGFMSYGANNTALFRHTGETSTKSSGAPSQLIFRSNSRLCSNLSSI